MPTYKRRKKTCPIIFELCWQWFLELNQARQAGINGLLPINYGEIWAYFALKKIHPKKHEIEAIILLDNIYLNLQQKSTN